MDDCGHGAFTAIPPFCLDEGLPVDRRKLIIRKLRIPDRMYWKNRRTMKEELVFFTNGSTIDIGTGARVYCEPLGINQSFRINDDYSVFQAEVTSFIQAVGKYSRD